MNDEIEMTELYDAVIPRVDMVKGPANTGFFIVAKAAESTADQNDLPDSDFAYIEPGGHKDADGKTVPRSLRHFPLTDAAHVRNALARAPQSPFGDKAMPKIKAAAEKFGVDVAKAADETPDADEVLADAAGGSAASVLDGQAVEASGDPDDTSSPAWEAVDAARARQMTQAVMELKASLTLAAEREAQEAVTGDDPDDADAACDLNDAQDALDYLLSVLAPFAVSEQAEADAREEARASLLKAMDAVSVAKAGRVLSAANLAAVKAAITALQEVLSAAEPPAPPASQEKEAAPVAKSEEVTEPVTEAVEAEVAKAEDQPLEEEVAKSKGDPQILVYDANGKVLGSVDPDNLTQFADSPASDDSDSADSASDDSDAADDNADDAADDSPTADAAEPATDDQTIPGTDTVQSPPDDTDDADVQKSALAEQLAAALEQVEVTKTSLRTLEERLARVEATPAAGGPRLNGATGSPGLASRDGEIEDPIADLRKAAEAETDPKRRAELQEAIAFAEIRKMQSGVAPRATPADFAEVLARFRM